MDQLHKEAPAMLEWMVKLKPTAFCPNCNGNPSARDGVPTFVLRDGTSC